MEQEEDYKTMNMNDNAVAKIFKGNAKAINLATEMIKYCIIYILMLITIIIGYWCYFWCCVCDKCCPPCECCRRNYENNPITKKELVIYTIVLIAISIAVIVSASIGLIKTGDIRYTTSETICEFL